MGLRQRLFALGYDRQMARAEEAGFAAIRARLLVQAAGRVLEIGAGTGLNLRHYSEAVTELTLTEPEPAMLRRLDRTAAESNRPVTVLRAPAEDLPFDDATFDTVVSTLVLCGVPDQPRAVREIRRVLKPGGHLLFAEHVRSDDEKSARHQDRMNWLNRLLVCCECNRPTQQTLRHCGFVLDEIVEHELPSAPSFTQPLVVGSATRPVG